MNRELLQKKLAKLKKQRNNPRFLGVMGFLVHKGLLRTNKTIVYTDELNIKDALWAAKVEPRILEVLPAAILHFPKSLKHQEVIPKSLKKVIEQIQQGIDLLDPKYCTMRRWANIELTDKRTKPTDHKKRQRNYRFTPETIAKLSKLKAISNRSETEILEGLIQNA